jgi:hypothetical protein
MVWASRAVFEHIVSIELSEKLCTAARARLTSLKHAEIIQGDSAIVLPEVIANLRGPALFWLDGHFSGEGTAYGVKASPICDEIQAIGRSPLSGHVILVDDARLFAGSDGYPRLGELRHHVEQHIGKCTISVKHDIIRIVPGQRETEQRAFI